MISHRCLGVGGVPTLSRPTDADVKGSELHRHENVPQYMKIQDHTMADLSQIIAPETSASQRHMMPDLG